METWRMAQCARAYENGYYLLLMSLADIGLFRFCTTEFRPGDENETADITRLE
jgi:hypothetical protein